MAMKLKYVVYKHPDGAIELGMVRDWRYHVDIMANAKPGSKPISAGFFTQDHEDPNRVLVYGESLGLRIGPNLNDGELIEKFLVEKRGTTVIEFFGVPKPGEASGL